MQSAHQLEGQRVNKPRIALCSAFSCMLTVVLQCQVRVMRACRPCMQLHGQLGSTSSAMMLVQGDDGADVACVGM